MTRMIQEMIKLANDLGHEAALSEVERYLTTLKELEHFVPLHKSGIEIRGQLDDARITLIVRNANEPNN